MSNRVELSGLKIDARLAAFIDAEVLAPLGIVPTAFWAGFAALIARFAPQNHALLAKREVLQPEARIQQVVRPHDRRVACRVSRSDPAIQPATNHRRHTPGSSQSRGRPQRPRGVGIHQHGR